MDREIDPIKYLPPVMQEVREIQELYRVVRPELELVYLESKRSLDECFVLSAEGYGLERMESMLGITPYTDDSVEDRRLRILTKLNGDTPYTFERLYEKLKTLCGEDNVYMAYSKDIYTLDVQISLIAKRQFETVKEMLLEIVPCNISLRCLLMYNTHRTLSAFTHKTLSVYTHRQLIEEVVG
jgi:hypothetical protein